MRPLCWFADFPNQVIATAIHAGHELRPEIAAGTALDDPIRFREEDPFTDRLTAVGAATVVAHRSRFEVDLNRSREQAVYRVPDDAWGLDLWVKPLSDGEMERSLTLYDHFYRDLGRHLDTVAARGPFLVLDLHSYNHRRDGADAPAATPSENPDINVGTGSLDRDRWGAVVDTFLEAMPHRDVRENVRFRGGELSRWVNAGYRDRGCALAIEFKKTFMDEWTGSLDKDHLEELRRDLAATLPALTSALASAPEPRAVVTTTTLPDVDLAVDRALADIAGSFRFLLDVTPVDLVDARDAFWRTGRTPEFQYRDLADDPAVTTARLADIPVNDVEDATVAHLLQAKHRELLLLLQMLSSRGSQEFLSLSIEAFGAVGPTLLEEAETILRDVLPSAPDPGPWLDAEAFAERARAELDEYRAFAPDIESHVELRAGSTGVMVSNGDVLIAPTARISAARAEALLQHEVGTHVVTYVNGAHQPLRVLATGLAGHDETQEGLAVFAEYLVGGLTANRLRQLAARVVAVHQMICGAEFADVHRGLVDVGVPAEQSFTITMRVFRSGGLTKDAVYLRGLHDLVGHLGAGRALEPLWLGKMPLDAVPLIEELHRRGVLTEPLLVPRYLDHPGVCDRLAGITEVTSLTSLVGGPT